MGKKKDRFRRTDNSSSSSSSSSSSDSDYEKPQRRYESGYGGQHGSSSTTVSNYNAGAPPTSIYIGGNGGSLSENIYMSSGGSLPSGKYIAGVAGISHEHHEDTHKPHKNDDSRHGGGYQPPGFPGAPNSGNPSFGFNVPDPNQSQFGYPSQFDGGYSGQGGFQGGQPGYGFQGGAPDYGGAGYPSGGFPGAQGGFQCGVGLSPGFQGDYSGGGFPGGAPTSGGPGYPGGFPGGAPPSGGPGYPGGFPGGAPPSGGPGYPGGFPGGATPSGGPGYGGGFPGGAPPSGGQGYPGGFPGGVPPSGGQGYPGGFPSGAPVSGGTGGYFGGAQPSTVGGVSANVSGGGGIKSDFGQISTAPIAYGSGASTAGGSVVVTPPSSQPQQPQPAASTPQIPVATYSGTLRPNPNFNAETDCNVIRQAMRGAGTDEQAIINVLACRTNAERQKIKQMFKTAYGKDMIKDLKSELSGHFEQSVISMLMTPDEYDAYCLHEAMAGAGTKEHILTEILCTRTNQQILALRDTYKRLHLRDLEKEVISETSGYYRRVLISCLQGNRPEDTTVVDQALAQREAQELFQAGEKKWGTDESCFIRILAIRNPYQLRATFNEYQRLAGKDIFKSIDSETSGDLCSSLKTLARSQVNRPAYFAKRLYDSMQGLGTADTTLIRVLISRSEIDLANIKDEFLRTYGKTLESFIADDTTGDYKKTLLALVKGNMN